MTSSCTALLSLPRASSRRGGVSASAASHPRLSHRFGLSFRVQKRPEVRKSVRVSCIGGNSKTAVVTSNSWDNLILDSEIPVLVEFYTSWCGPCRMVHRVIDELAINYSGRLKCYILNADNDPKVAEDYDIKAVPVVLLFKNGQKLDSVVGTMPKEFYVAAIERLLCS